MATTTQDTINKNCKIINNTSSDIVVIDAVGSDTSSTVQAQQIYNQNLSLLKTTDGQSIITKNTTGTVTLDDTYKDPDTGKDTYSTLYQLILAAPSNLFPIKIQGEMLNFFANPETYPDVTTTDTDVSNMKLAQQFQQTILAYPTSDLAKNFSAALNNTQQTANSTSDIDKGVAAFFASTQQYQSLDLNMVTAVSTYYNAFCYIWAQYKDTMTYYLYSSDGTTQKAEGTLTLTRTSSSSPAKVTDHNSGYTITYTDSSGNTTPMFYSNGQFVSSLTDDVPAICLMGTFMVKSQLTGKDSDNVIMTVLTGSVNSIKTIGVDTKQDQGDDKWAWLGFQVPKTLMGWISLVMQVVGIWMLIDFVKQKLSGTKEGAERKVSEQEGKDLTEEQFDDIKTQMDNIQAEMRQNQQDLLDKFGQGEKLPETVDQGIQTGREDLTDQLNDQQRDALENGLDAQAERVETVAQYDVTPELEQIASDIKENVENLENATSDTLPDVNKTAQTNLSDINDRVDTQVENVSSEVSEQVRQEMQEQADVAKEVQEDAEKTKEDTNDAEDGTADEDLDPVDVPIE